VFYQLCKSHVKQLPCLCAKCSGHSSLLCYTVHTDLLKLNSPSSCFFQVVIFNLCFLPKIYQALHKIHVSDSAFPNIKTTKMGTHLESTLKFLYVTTLQKYQHKQNICQGHPCILFIQILVLKHRN